MRIECSRCLPPSAFEAMGKPSWWIRGDLGFVSGIPKIPGFRPFLAEVNGLADGVYVLGVGKSDQPQHIRMTFRVGPMK